MDPIFSKGKRRDCKDIQDADEQEECAFVLSDINDFLATTGNKNPGLTVVNLVKNGLQNNNKVECHKTQQWLALHKRDYRVGLMHNKYNKGS